MIKHQQAYTQHGGTISKNILYSVIKSHNKTE